VQVLELREMRWRAAVPLELATGTVVVRWLDAHHLVAFAEQADGLRALVFDAETSRIVHTTRISGHLTDRQQVDVARTRAVVLLGARRAAGPARVAIVSSPGSVRIVELARIDQGAQSGALYRPALVADPTADRAYVVGAADQPVAAIDLRTLRVSYRRPFARGSADFTGGERMAVWLGQGRLAVSGWDDGMNGSQLLGLRIVDTHSWRGRLLDPESDFACAAGHSVVGHHVDGTLSVFGADGRRRAVVSSSYGVSPFPSVGNDRYLYLASGDQVLDADLATGAVSGPRTVPGLQQLLSPAYAAGAGCR
jgi:hypothetical protein